MGICFGQGIEQVDAAIALRQIVLGQQANTGQMLAQKRHPDVVVHGHAVLFTFAVADDDHALVKIDVLDAQAGRTPLGAGPAAVEQAGHRLVHAGHQVEHTVHFGLHSGQALKLFGTQGVAG